MGPELFLLAVFSIVIASGLLFKKNPRTARAVLATLIIALAAVGIPGIFSDLHHLHSRSAALAFAFIAVIPLLAIWILVAQPFRRFLPQASIEEFIVVCLIVPDGIDERVAEVVSARMNSFNPDTWILLQPSTYNFFFRGKTKGDERASIAVEQLVSAKTLNPRLEKMRIGKASGELLAEISRDGTVRGIPLGKAASDAAKNAV